MSLKEPSDRGTASILIVDDECAVRQMAAHFLRRSSYRVTEAASAAEALEIARAVPLDLVITDLCMGEMNGFEFIARLRTLPYFGATPIIVWSGAFTDERARSLVARYGVRRFLRKTDLAPTFLSAVKEALAETGARAVVPAGKNLEREQRRLLNDTLCKTVGELRGSEERFRLLVENVKDYAIFLLDADGGVASWNAGAERITGYCADEVVGRHFSCFYQPREREAGAPAGALQVASAQGRYEVQAWRIRKDGSLFWADEVITPVLDPDGGLRGFAKVTRDMTAQRRASEERDGLLAQLRALSERMERVREEERTRIAREVHDELGQSLTALKMDLLELETRLPGKQKPLAKSCAAMHGIIDHTVAVVQQIAGELRLGHLSELGLRAALEWQVQQFERRTGIACALTCWEDLCSVDEMRATAVYRIVQESLTNIMRHARASIVRIHLTRDAGRLVLEIQDNGRGITREQVADQRSIGLLGMRERAHAFGGTVEIDGVPDVGTRLALSLPLPTSECP